MNVSRAVRVGSEASDEALGISTVADNPGSGPISQNTGPNSI
jgi:hypothetical protein